MKTPLSSLSFLEEYTLLSDKQKQKIWSRLECFEINIIENIDEYLEGIPPFTEVEHLLESIFLDLQYWFFINEPGPTSSKDTNITSWFMNFIWDTEYEKGVDVSKSTQAILSTIQQIDIHNTSPDIPLKSISSVFKKLVVMLKSSDPIKKPMVPWLLLDMLISKLLELCLLVRIKEVIES